MFWQILLACIMWPVGSFFCSFGIIAPIISIRSMNVYTKPLARAGLIRKAEANKLALLSVLFWSIVDIVVIFLVFRFLKPLPLMGFGIGIIISIIIGLNKTNPRLPDNRDDYLKSYGRFFVEGKEDQATAFIFTETITPDTSSEATLGNTVSGITRVKNVVEKRIAMNFLDAHKIFWDYVRTVENSKGQLFPSEKLFPFYCDNWKDKVIAAYQIVLCHSALFCELTNEEVNKAFNLLHCITDYVDDDLSVKLRKAEEILNNKDESFIENHKEQIAEAQKLVDTEYSKGNDYRYDDVFSVYNAMVNYKNETIVPRAKNGEKDSVLIPIFTKKTYEEAKLYYTTEYDKYFIQIKDMKNHCNEGQLFYPYREDIMASRI